MAKNEGLDNRPIRETNLADQGGNMYKFYMASCICEIIDRFKLNNEKRQKIEPILKRLCESRDSVNLDAGGGGTEVGFIDFAVKDFQSALSEKFGDYEGERIGSFFLDNDY